MVAVGRLRLSKNERPRRFHRFAEEIALERHTKPTLMNNQEVSTMHIYITAGDFRSAIRYFNDPDDVYYLVQCYEAIDYDQAIPTLADLAQ